LQGARHIDLDVDHGGGLVSIGGGAPAGVALIGSEAFGLEYKSHHDGEGLGIDIDAGPTFFPFFGVNTWASRVKLILPAIAGHTLVDFEAGAASLEVVVPEMVAARIRLDQGLSSTAINEKCFPRIGTARNYYQSAGYDAAENKVEFNFEGGASSLIIR
jgi:hypothetical protein